MKIYFEDGYLVEDESIMKSGVMPSFVLDSNLGATECIYWLDWHKRIGNADGRSYSIYTNFILAFDNKYAWNDELEVPEIYIRDKNRYYNWIRIDELTERHLHEGDNLMKLYFVGEFTN